MVRDSLGLQRDQGDNLHFAGTLRVHNIRPPFPRAVKGKFHILLAHIRQLHLTSYLLRTSASDYDVYFVDQLSTCVPILRALARKRVVFYCHFPDKLLANGAFTEGNLNKRSVPLLKRIYRYPMDWLEEATTSM
jgi:alpha-1,3/alpha-1,6-mannosyltransferase